MLGHLGSVLGPCWVIRCAILGGKHGPGMAPSLQQFNIYVLYPAPEPARQGTHNTSLMILHDSHTVSLHEVCSKAG